MTSPTRRDAPSLAVHPNHDVHVYQEKTNMNNAEDSFHASPDAIRKLQLILSKVAENDGTMVAGEMWSDEDLEHELVINATGNKDATISLANSILKREEDLLQSISFLHSSLTTRVSSFRAQRPKRSVTDLPNEIILFIIKLSEPGIDNLRHLLLVSKRFRQLTLSSPRLWARQMLNPSLSSYTIDTIARRSGVLGLRANFDSLPDAGHAMFHYCDKWTALSLTKLSEDDVTRFQSYVPCVKLACLESLDLDLKLSESWDNIWLLNNSTWSLPSLKYMRHISATSMLLLPQSPALSFCVLGFQHFLPIGKLATFLSACPSLKRLVITLDDIEDGNTDNNVLLETSLPTLKHFTLSSFDVENPVVEGLLRSISFPKITTFLVEYCCSGQISAVDCFWEILREMKSRYPELKQALFYVASGKEPFDDYVVNLLDILKELPDSLQNLILKFQNIYLRADDSGFGPVVAPRGGLRTIGFVNCNLLIPEFFDGLGTLFKKYGIKCDDIRFINCTELVPVYMEWSDSEFHEEESGDSDFDDEESSDSGSQDEEPSYDVSGDEQLIY